MIRKRTGRHAIAAGMAVCAAALACCPLATARGTANVTAATPATAVASGDGFTGWEKEITAPGGSEPEIAVGPTGGPLLVAFNGCGIAVSKDRGASFVVNSKHPADPGPTPGDPYHSCSDPAATVGPGNLLYTGAGWWDTPGGAVDYYNMYVTRSRDGGATWSAPAFATGDHAAPQQLLLGRNTGHTDRLFLTADTSTGTVYASATDFPRFVRWVVASHDGGSTFGPPSAIDSSLYPEIQGQQAGDYIPAAANGVVAFAYAASAAPGSTSCPCPIFETSRDDGATWTRHPAPFAANWVAADPSHPGRFAIMSGQGATATPAFSGAIAVSTTDDSGRTWSRPVLLGEPEVHPEIQPWISYSPTGVLGVGYKTLYTGLISQQQFFFDIVSGQLSYTYDFWTAASFDNGLTFSQPLRVSNAVSPPGNRDGNDDFANVALDDSYLYAAWGDQRKSPTDPSPGPTAVYFARVPLQAYSTYPAPPGPGQPSAPVVVVGGGRGVNGGPASAVPGAANPTPLEILGTSTQACVPAKRLIFTINPVPHGRVVRVQVTVNGHHLLTKTGHNVKRISFARPSGSRLVVVIVTINNRGGGVLTTRTFRGCARTKVSGKALGHARSRRGRRLR
jgi:hypothetical protein